MPLDAEAVRSALAGRYANIYEPYTTLRLVCGRWVGPCPIHGGDGPNFKVDPATGGWHCFSGCHDGGDLFKFLMLAEGLTFPEAVERAGAFAGLSPDAAPRPLFRRPIAAKPAPIPPPPLDPCEAERMHRRLMKSSSMRAWLEQERGLTTATLERFQIGMHRDDRPGNPDEGFYRITFPVYDRQGRLMNIRKHLFGYRPELTGERREALGKTKSWRPEGNWLDLYPLAVLDGAREALIVEGEADALLACQMGFAAVTGTGGAGTWKERWSQDLRGLDRVTILYDDDDAGDKGIPKVGGSVSAVVPDVRVARYPGWLARTDKKSRGDM